MFNLLTITLTNFRSYVGTHEFDFPQVNGLYFLTGKNLVEPSLGANGSGKSTLLDAICWCLFGRTVRGLKANEVLSWGQESGCAVTLDLIVGKDTVQIQRTQKPNGLFLDGKPLDQEELQKTIRLNFDSFKYSVLNAQFEPSFFALSPSAKLTLFSDIMELDFWLKKSDEASKLVGEISTLIDDCKMSISRNEGQASSIAKDIVELEQNEATFADGKAEKLKAIKDEISSLYKQIDNLDNRLSKIEIKKSKLQGQLKLAAEDVRDNEEARENFLAKIAKVSKKRNELVTERELLNKQHKQLAALDNTCPTCFQSVGHDHKNKFKKIAQQIEISLNSDIANVDAILHELTRNMVLANSNMDASESKANALRDEVSDLDIDWTKTRVKLGTANNQKSLLISNQNEIETAKNPYSTMLASKRSKLVVLEKQLKDDIAVIDELEADLESTKFWIKGFKRVRLFIIEQAFQSLEIEVNNSLAQLGMTDWQVTFDVERENKSGGVTKGFVVFIKSPANKEPVRWENWSGGETQRLQLAGDLGLANLIMQQHGLANTVEFFDEPSTHLSQEGMLDLANMLHDRAISEGKRIWIADHTSITNFGEFEGIITVRKKSNGSSITIDSQ